MKLDKNTPRILGGAFLLQIIAPIISSAFLLGPLIVPDNISESMTNIANNALQLQASIVVEMFTVFGITTIGVLMYVILKEQDTKVATLALGLYIVEAAILAVSKIPIYALLVVSRESVIMGHPTNLLALGELFYELQSYGYSMHMLPFALGASLFYYLFYKSGYIPKALNILGLIAAPLAFFGTLFALLGFTVPIAVFILNLPFELGLGLWLLFKGISEEEVTGSSPSGRA